MLVDSHCHLDFPDFESDIDQVIARARNAGVGVMQTISTRLESFESVRSLAARFEDVYCSVGVHPHNAGDAALATPEQLAVLANDSNVIGIGETGLDYYYEHSPRESQKESFRAHIVAARKTGLPVIVHSRDADQDTTEILTEEMGKGAFPGLIHCFTSGPELAENALKLGLSISLSGIVTFKSAEDLRQVVRNVPLDRLLVETDAPYLAPMPYRGKRNEPAFVRHTATYLAEMMNISTSDFFQETTRNFFRLFEKAQSS